MSRTDQTLREAVALDYIRDGQQNWDELDNEERHGSLEMARWVLEDASRDDLEGHIWSDPTLEPDALSNQ